MINFRSSDEEMSNLKMSIETNWSDYDAGYSLGTVGADGGAIVRDEEHESGARITLEEEGSSAPFTVTCGIYGWMLHTRYFSEESEADEEYDRMKNELDELLESIPAEEESLDEETEDEIREKIELFVEKYP
jgi:hypothetical protein